MNTGLANQATLRFVVWTLVALVSLFMGAWAGRELGGFILEWYKVFIALWAVFIVAVVYLARDPDPAEPSDANAIVAPAHGRIESIEDALENDFIRGPCKRLSIRVALTDVQMQYAPLAGTIAHCDHRLANQVNGVTNPETLLVGLDVVGRPATKAAVRLIGGTWGRRILPWVKANDVMTRSVRLAMMRPASRVELYLPPHVKLFVNPGDAVAGGQTVVAKFE